MSDGIDLTATVATIETRSDAALVELAGESVETDRNVEKAAQQINVRLRFSRRPGRFDCEAKQRDKAA